MIKMKFFCSVKSWLNSHKLLNLWGFFFIKRGHHHFFYICAYWWHIFFLKKKWVQSFGSIQFIFRTKNGMREKLWIMWWMPGLYTKKSFQNRKSWYLWCSFQKQNHPSLQWGYQQIKWTDNLNGRISYFFTLMIKRT